MSAGGEGEGRDLERCEGRSTGRKWSHQLGLYRARVDAKSEEFLRMSRRRQLRRGGACALLVSAITTLTVLVIIVVYEYSFAVSSTAVQRAGSNSSRKNNVRHNEVIQDRPFADQLNRRNLILDQELFSKMPLLINALQENSYVDSSSEQHFTASSSNEETRGRSYNGWSPARKTSPRPFIFEYRTPTPTPFRKTTQYSPRVWLDNYRNTQRLKNLENVINYLQKTVHAKVADLVPSSSDRLITFSGAYIHPPLDETDAPSSSGKEYLETAESKKVGIGQPFQSDILFKYKPNHPGEINMLADEMLRFSPIIAQSSPDHQPRSNIPLFRPIKYPQRDTCYGIKCPPHDLVFKYTTTSPTIQTELDKKNLDRSKLLSLMLNIFPMDKKEGEPLRRKVTKVISMPRPSFHSKNLIRSYKNRPEINLFNNRVRAPIRATMNRVFAPPRLYGRVRNLKIVNPDTKLNVTNEIATTNVYSNTYLKMHHDPVPAEISSSSIESLSMANPVDQPERIIKQVAHRDPPFFYSTVSPDMVTITTNDNFYNMVRFNNLQEYAQPTERYTEWRTEPPEMVKFNPEDAKVPDVYQYSTQRRTYFESVTTAMPESRQPIEYVSPEPERRSMSIKLRNEHFIISSTSTLPPTTTSTTHVPTTTSVATTEAPTAQINGHYRSLNQNSRNINDWLVDPDENETTTTQGTITSSSPDTSRIPYVVINRNSTKSTVEPTFGARIKKDP